MEKLSMCRVCSGENIRLHSIVGTHLQEMYESLVSMPLETKDNRPLMVCYVCRARLENCFDLRRSCLRSEELLTQMLSSNESEQVKLQGINNKRLTMHNVIHLSMGHVLEMNADKVVLDALKCEVKHEDIDKNSLEKNSVFDNVQSADFDNNFVITMSVEQTGGRACDSIPEESIQDDLRNPEDLTTSNLKDHELVQDTSQAVHKLIAADVTAITSTNKVTLTLADDSKERPTNVPRSERVQYTCDTCQQCYNSEWELERHIRLCSDVWYKDLLRANTTSTHTHTTQKPYRCKVCNKGFVRMYYYLTHHMRTHGGEKPYQCKVCNKSFTREDYLTSHMCTHTREKPHQCNICKKQFSQKNNLRQHMLTHGGGKPYQCTICKKHFSSEGCLRSHMRTHTGEKPYQCKVCKKSFTRLNDLTRHMRTHSGEKPYQCNLCEKKFSSKNYIKIHMRTHTGEKPYQCKVCNKSFTRGDYLTRHMCTHTREKPHQCYICKKQFSQKNNLRRHILTHGGGKPYQCTDVKSIFHLKVV